MGAPVAPSMPTALGQSRRLWFSQQVRLAIFCLGVSAGGDYFDNTFSCVHLHSVICSSFGLNTHVGDANFLIVTTGEFRPVARHSSPNHYGCYVIVADKTLCNYFALVGWL